MADIFDITSNKKARGPFDESSNNKYEWESNIRRDPRLKTSPKPEHKFEGNEKGANRTTSVRDPRQEEKPNQAVWMAKQIPQEYRPNNNYPMPPQPPIQQLYNDQRAQYNTSYPPPMNPQQQNPYPFHGQTGNLQEYAQNQYHLQQPYYPASGDGNYIQGQHQPTTMWQNAQPPPEHRDLGRAPPPQHAHTPTVQSHPQVEPKIDDSKKEAIAQEVKKHRATLRKQRGEYLQKSTQLRRELDMLKAQKQQLVSDLGSGNVPRDTQRILRENTKLQEEIQTKLKAMNDVIDMLSDIICDGVATSDDNGKREKSFEHQTFTGTTERDNLSPRVPKELEKKTPPSSTDQGAAYNFVHYDPELHWCRVCDVFPTSAKELLVHLHSDQHRDTTRQHQMVDMPWHNLPPDQELPSTVGAPVKRTPIKGLQFFISAPAWYCKLCDKWIGDLHCASLHLKSKLHIQNYTHFVEQNPHWETDWITDREKAFARAHKKGTGQAVVDTSTLPELSSPDPSSLTSELKNKKRKKRGKDKRDSRSSSREKKKKKKSRKRKKVVSSDSSSASTSSSDSSSDDEGDDDTDKSKSIRVAMRNKMKMQAQMMLTEELNVLTKLVEDGKQRKSRQAAEAQSNSTLSALTAADPSKSQKDNDLLTFQAFRNRAKQQTGFKQSQAVSLTLPENQNENNENSKQNIQKQLIDRHNEPEKDNRSGRYSGPNDGKQFEKYDSSDKKKHEERYRSGSPGRKRSFDRYGSPPEMKKYYDKYGSPKKYGDRYSPDRKKSYGHESTDYRNKRYADEKYSRGKHENSSKYGRENRGYPKNKEDVKKNEEYESKFEKQTAASAAKQSSKSPLMTIQQKKLPFIGRMPLFKKKTDSDEKKEPEKSEVKSKFSSSSSNKLPAPGLVHIAQLSTPSEYQFNADNPPPPPQIIPDPPMIIPEPPQISAYMCAPPPPVLSHLMEQGDDVAMLMAQGGTDGKGPLPRDLQDALNIIFPGDKPKDEVTDAQEAMMMTQYQIMENYGFPGAMEYDPNIQGYVMAQMPPLPVDDMEANDAGTDKDDLAMLGIDAEDLAAQQL